MALEWVLRVVFLGIVHWLLAGVLLQDLAYRRRVFGGRKLPWALIIIFVTGFGSLLYLFFHPQILNPDYYRREDRDGERDEDQEE